MTDRMVSLKDVVVTYVVPCILSILLAMALVGLAHS